MGLSKKFWRTPSGMIITAKNDTSGGENHAIDENDEPGFLQIRKLGVLDFAIDLRHGLLAAHRQHRVSQPDKDSHQSHRMRQGCECFSQPRASLA